MAFIVQVFRRNKEGNAKISFNFHYEVWFELLRIAKEEGWRPEGTRPDPHAIQPFENNYDPSYPDSKIITAKDAYKFSLAVEKAVKKLQSGEITLEQRDAVILHTPATGSSFHLVSASISLSLLQSFLQYLRQGELEFWWDD